MKTTTEKRIYVASLSDYNNGNLHGVWISLEGNDENGVFDEIEEMLEQSKQENAEEWEIHDVEGLPRSMAQNSIETICKYVELCEDKGEAFDAAMEYYCDVNEAIETVVERYCGEYSSKEDWAREMFEESGQLESLPEVLRNYFDYEKYVRDCELSGDMLFVEKANSVHVFYAQ